MSDRWISTKQRLPKVNTTVLFAAPGNNLPHYGYIVSDGRWWDGSYNVIVNYKVTHWRPLPQMPRRRKSQ